MGNFSPKVPKLGNLDEKKDKFSSLRFIFYSLPKKKKKEEKKVVNLVFLEGGREKKECFAIIYNCIFLTKRHPL